MEQRGLRGACPARRRDAPGGDRTVGRRKRRPPDLSRARQALAARPGAARRARFRRLGRGLRRGRDAVAARAAAHLARPVRGADFDLPLRRGRDRRMPRSVAGVTGHAGQHGGTRALAGCRRAAVPEPDLGRQFQPARFDGDRRIRNPSLRQIVHVRRATIRIRGFSFCQERVARLERARN